MITATALLNYLLSFCPIDLHSEPFNYTIHLRLNVKNGAERTPITPCRKVFCKGAVNQADGSSLTVFARVLFHRRLLQQVLWMSLDGACVL